MDSAMARTQRDNEKYSEHEAALRFMTALRAAVNTPPKPLKSMTPKRPNKQSSNKKKGR
jgi:hypothetical protein